MLSALEQLVVYRRTPSGSAVAHEFLSAIERSYEAVAAPILAPTDWQWESGVTFNAAVTYLEPSETNRRLTSLLLAGTVDDHATLRDGLVAQLAWHRSRA